MPGWRGLQEVEAGSLGDRRIKGLLGVDEIERFRAVG
jgi:hypothetical protein